MGDPWLARQMIDCPSAPCETCGQAHAPPHFNGAFVMPAVRLSWLLVCLPLLGACTVVQIQKSGDAAVDVRHLPGLVSIVLTPGDRGAIVLQTAGLGAARTPTGLTLGAWRETAALFGARSDCRTVIWLSDVHELAAIEASLSKSGRALNSLCIIRGGQPP